MRRFCSTAIATSALVLLVGCSGPSGTDEASAQGGASEAVDAVDAVAAPGDPGVPDPERQVVTTASAALEVEDPAVAARRVSELVESAGGRVDERTEQAASGQGDGASADLVVRVPAAELTGVLADLQDLGDVASVSVSRSDQTATAVDLDARISALRSSVARLQALMDDAGSTAALLDAEKALSERQEQLESLQSRRALLADQVELSTLSVHLAPFGVAPAGGADGFSDGLGTGWRALTSALGAAVVVLGIALPWLVLAALVAAAVLVPFRVARRRAARGAPAPEG